MTEKTEIRIQQFAHNPNANFSVAIWIDGVCHTALVCNDYELIEDVQSPKYLNKVNKK